jgi:CRP-like cAMP-binding protein
MLNPTRVPTVLATLTSQHRAEVLAAAPIVDVDYGVTLMEPGDDDASLAWLLDGEVSLALGGFEVGIAGPGDVIGATEVIGTPMRHISARTVRPTRMMLVDRATYRGLVVAGNEFAARLEQAALRSLSDRLRAIDAQLAAMAASAPPAAPRGLGRVLRTLLAGRSAGSVDVADVLRSSRLFADADDSVIAALAPAFRAIVVPRGDRAVVGGQPSQRVLLHVDGAMDPLVTTDDGQYAAGITRHAEGTLIGVTAAVTGRPNPATWLAHEDVTALMMPTTAFCDLIDGLDASGTAMRRAAILAIGDAVDQAHTELRDLDRHRRLAIRASLADLTGELSTTT